MDKRNVSSSGTDDSERKKGWNDGKTTSPRVDCNVNNWLVLLGFICWTFGTFIDSGGLDFGYPKDVLFPVYILLIVPLAVARYKDLTLPTCMR